MSCKIKFICLLIFLTSPLYAQVTIYNFRFNIDLSAMMMEQSFDGLYQVIGFTGYLFDEEPPTEQNDWFISRGLTVSGFPRTGSLLSRKMWAAINRFIQDVGARPGDYFALHLNDYPGATSIDQAYYEVESVRVLYVEGFFQSDMSIRGRCYHR
jgi:hypothetical protein